MEEPTIEDVITAIRSGFREARRRAGDDPLVFVQEVRVKITAKGIIGKGADAKLVFPGLSIGGNRSRSLEDQIELDFVVKFMTAEQIEDTNKKDSRPNLEQPIGIGSRRNNSNVPPSISEDNK